MRDRKSSPVRRTSRFFIQSFTLFLLLMALPVVLLVSYNISTQQQAANAKVESLYTAALENSVSNVDSIFSDLSTLATQITGIPWVSRYVYASDTRVRYEMLDQLDLSDQIEELSVFKITNSILNGIVLSFDDKGFVISSYGRARSDTFYNEFFQFGDYSAQDWHELFAHKEFMKLVGPCDANIYSSTRRLLLCVTSLPTQGRQSYAHLIFSLDCEKLFELAQNGAALDQGLFSVYTEDGQYVSGDELNPQRLDLLIENKEKDLSMFSLNGETTFWAKSQTQPLLFAVTLPSQAMHLKFTQTAMLSLLAMTVYLLCAVYAAFRLARHFSRPIEHMLQSLTGGDRNRNAGSDLVFLENAVHTLLKGEEVTLDQLETFKPYALNTLLTQMLSSDMSVEVFGSKLCDMLDIQLYYQYFVAMSLLTGSDMFLHDRLNPLFVQAHENDYISVYFCDIDARHKAVILNYNDGQQLQSLVDSVYEAVNAHVPVRACGVGGCYDSSDSLGRSYEEAQFAMNCRMVDQDLSILYYRQITFPHSKAVYLPNTDAIITTLLAGDAQRACQIAQDQIDETLGKGAAPLTELRHLYYLMATLAPKALAEQGYPAQSLLEPVNAILSETSVKAMRTLLETVYAQTAARLTSLNEAGSLSINDVICYLRAHYNDPSLSLNAAADHFGVSASYLSRVFKNNCGVNFLDYLNRYRIDQAKKLLHSGTTILTVAKQVGFDNDATFRRLFKKYAGTTPSRYKPTGQ